MIERGSTLAEVSAQLRERLVSSVDLTAAALKRIRRDQAVLNAFVSVDEAGAMASARAADAALASGSWKGPLHGMPLAHKDMFYRRGEVVTCGSPLRHNWRAHTDATVLSRLTDAGAVTLGTLNMAEFAYSPTGANNLTGPARNPWNPHYICGGSSSGSAASVAAGLCFGALGSDTGGSIRIPAALCGVVGIKPTQGLVSRHGCLPLSFSLDCIGPLARTTRDAALLLETIAGYDGNDPTTTLAPHVNLRGACDNTPAGVRIGIPERYFWEHLDAGHALALERALGMLAQAGFIVRKVATPDLTAVLAAANIVLAVESLSLHGKNLRMNPSGYSDFVRVRIENGLGYTPAEYVDALKYRASALRVFLTCIAEVDVLVTPTVGVRTPRIADITSGSQVDVSPIAARLSYWTRPVNYLGLPAISVPCGMDSEGLPVGLQLIGKPFAERLLISTSAAFERARGALPHPVGDPQGANAAV